MIIIMHICNMGDQRAYVKGKNDFESYLYTSMSARVTINGATGRMIADKNDPYGEHAHLPAYSGKSDIYFYPDKDGKATQAKLYDGNKMRLDFDWNHTHENKSKGKVTETFPEGVVHVQEYVSKKVWSDKYKKYVDKFVRKSNKARLMTEDEIAKYGPIILHFNSDVKFRP